MSQAEVGKAMGISRSAVQQIESMALRKLRALPEAKKLALMSRISDELDIEASMRGQQRPRGAQKTAGPNGRVYPSKKLAAGGVRAPVRVPVHIMCGVVGICMRGGVNEQAGHGTHGRWRMSEWDCETNGCRIVDGYCKMCGVSADGTHDKLVKKRDTVRTAQPEPEKARDDKEVVDGMAEAKFKVGQIVVMVNKAMPFRILAMEWRDGWFYAWSKKNYAAESMIRAVTLGRGTISDHQRYRPATTANPREERHQQEADREYDRLPQKLHLPVREWETDESGAVGANRWSAGGKCLENYETH